MDFERQRVENFCQYKMFNVMDNLEYYVYLGDSFFIYFCCIKLEDLSDIILEIFSMVKEIIDFIFENFFVEDFFIEVIIYFIVKFGIIFFQFVVCVWQVYKFVFVFYFMVCIFCVVQFEKFVEKYMEFVIFQELEFDEDEDMFSLDIF